MEFKYDDQQDAMRELQEQSMLADVGETGAVYMHELGNALNNILLDLRLLQRELPDEFNARLSESCDVVVKTAKQMHQVAQYRQGCRAQPYRIDCGQLVQTMVTESEDWLGRVTVTVPETPILVVTTIASLKRVVRLLIDNLVKPFSSGDRLEIRFERKADAAVLQFGSSAPRIQPDEMLSLFEAFPIKDTPCNSLELAVCKNLIRKMNGSLEVTSNDPHGVTIAVSLPLDSAPQ